MLATYMWHMRINNLEIRIVGSSCHMQLTKMSKQWPQESKIWDLISFNSSFFKPCVKPFLTYKPLIECSLLLLVLFLFVFVVFCYFLGKSVF